MRKQSFQQKYIKIFIYLFLFDLYLTSKISLRLKISFTGESWPRMDSSYSHNLQIETTNGQLKHLKTIANQ